MSDGKITEARLDAMTDWSGLLANTARRALKTMSNPLITVITPTDCNRADGLLRLRESLLAQTMSDWRQVIVSDDVRKIDERCLGDQRIETLVHPRQVCVHTAPGASARALGLQWATTPYVTFCDDDCWFESQPLEQLVCGCRVFEKRWGWSLRRIWSNSGECLGVDKFESYGEKGITSYKMVDMNSLVMAASLGYRFSAINRALQTYDEDRRLYQWLRDDIDAGRAYESHSATLNQVCPRRLEMMFKEGCSPE